MLNSDTFDFVFKSSNIADELRNDSAQTIMTKVIAFKFRLSKEFREMVNSGGVWLRLFYCHLHTTKTHNYLTIIMLFFPFNMVNGFSYVNEPYRQQINREID